jgi:hypothetical protein
MPRPASPLATCSALKKDGESCRFRVKSGTKFCGVHNKRTPPQPVKNPPPIYNYNVPINNYLLPSNKYKVPINTYKVPIVTAMDRSNIASSAIKLFRAWLAKVPPGLSAEAVKERIPLKALAARVVDFQGVHPETDFAMRPLLEIKEKFVAANTPRLTKLLRQQ